MQVGIWGYGFVGQAQHYIIDESTTQVTIYDIKEKYKDYKSSMLSQDIIFICLPTPAAASGAQNAQLVVEALEYLRTKNYQGTVVVKSTVLARHIEWYAETLNLCYNPEFLNQNTSFEDALNQGCIVLGGEPQATLRVEEFYSKHTHIEYPTYEFMSIKEASDFKHIRNVYGAYKVLFWEFVEDTTSNSRKMADLFKKVSYQSEMSQVGMDGFRGFGGACFPKDTSAWDKEHNHELTKFMMEYNKNLQS